MELHVIPLLQYIPAGKISTYGDFARFLGVPKNSRQIGYILGHNEYPDIFPCYKIIASGGSLGGYSTVLGLSEKRKLLKRDGIELAENTIKNLEEVRWQPRWHSYFLAVPLDKENRAVFSEAVETVQKLLPEKSIVTLQQTDSPHVTLCYFGDIGLDYLSSVVAVLRRWEEQKHRKKIGAVFKGLSYFGPKRKRTAGFFDCVQGKSEYLEFQQELISTLRVKNDRVFTPHITLLRVKDTVGFDAYEEQLRRSMRNISLSVRPNIIRLYAAIDQQHQVPLVDFEI